MPGSKITRDTSVLRYRKNKLANFEFTLFNDLEGKEKYQADAGRVHNLFYNGREISQDQLLIEIGKINLDAKEHLERELHQEGYVLTTKAWLYKQMDLHKWALRSKAIENTELHFSYIGNELRVTEINRINEASYYGFPDSNNYQSAHEFRHEKNECRALTDEKRYKPKDGIAYFETTYITTFPEKSLQNLNRDENVKFPTTRLYDVAIHRQDKKFCDVFLPDDRKILTVIRDFFMALFGKHISRRSAIPKPPEETSLPSELASQSMLRP